MVTKMDRLARFTSDLLAIGSRLQAKGVALVIRSVTGNAPTDTRTPTGRFLFMMLDAVAIVAKLGISRASIQRVLGE